MISIGEKYGLRLNRFIFKVYILSLEIHTRLTIGMGPYPPLAVILSAPRAPAITSLAVKILYKHVRFLPVLFVSQYASYPNTFDNFCSSQLFILLFNDLR